MTWKELVMDEKGGESVDGWDSWITGSRSLEEAKAGIRDHITAAAQNFIAIGYWLKCIRDGKLYEQDGYGTVWDLAEAE